MNEMLRFAKKQRASFVKAAREFDLDLIVLFGSQIKRGISPKVDVDIAVLTRNGLDISSYSLLCHRLGKIIGNYNIDLTFLKHASPMLLGQIAKNCQLLYERRKGDFLNFRLSAMRKYADAWPIFKWQERYFRKKIIRYKKELSK